MPTKSKSIGTEHVYVGIKGCVVAIRKHDGGIAWSTKLPRGMAFVPIIHDGDRLFAAVGGEVSCLDAATGTILWTNPLKGYGMGYAALAGAGFSISAAAMEAQAAAAAGGAAAIMATS